MVVNVCMQINAPNAYSGHPKDLTVKLVTTWSKQFPDMQVYTHYIINMIFKIVYSSGLTLFNGYSIASHLRCFVQPV